MRQCGARNHGQNWIRCDRCGSAWEPPIWDRGFRPPVCHELLMLARKRAIHDKINELRKEYEAKCKPLFDELRKIEDCEGPKPIHLLDGRVMSYVGPLATWTPEGITYDELRAPDAARPKYPDQDAVLPGDGSGRSLE